MKSPDLPLVSFWLDGREVQAVEGETILQAAARVGVEIPRLCYKDGWRPDGNCRSCVVEVAGERVLAPSCCRVVTPGMDVKARSERALKSQKMVLELLLADMPEAGFKWNDDAGSVGGAGVPPPQPSPGGGGGEAGPSRSLDEVGVGASPLPVPGTVDASPASTANSPHGPPG